MAPFLSVTCAEYLKQNSVCGLVAEVGGYLKVTWAGGSYVSQVLVCLLTHFQQVVSIE